jgi:hypothetical protein
VACEHCAAILPIIVSHVVESEDGFTFGHSQIRPHHKDKFAFFPAVGKVVEIFLVTLLFFVVFVVFVNQFYGLSSWSERGLCS